VGKTANRRAVEGGPREIWGRHQKRRCRRYRLKRRFRDRLYAEGSRAYAEGRDRQILVRARQIQLEKY
jgi:hypothetical protein